MLCVFTQPDAEAEASLSRSPSVRPVRVAGRRASIELGSYSSSSHHRRISETAPHSGTGADGPDLQMLLSGMQKVLVPEGLPQDRLEELGFGGGTLHGISYVKQPGCAFVDQEKSRRASTISCYFKGDLIDGQIYEEQSRDDLNCRTVISTYRKAATMQSVQEHTISQKSGQLRTRKFYEENRRQERMVENSVRAKLRGSFALVLYDSARGRILAARDKEGEEPLFWARGADGNSLYFATDKRALHEHEDRVEEFPAGGVFLSHPGQLNGALDGEPFPTAHDHDQYLVALQNSPARIPRSQQRLGKHRSSFHLPGPKPDLDGGSSLQQPARVRRTVSDIGELAPVGKQRSSFHLPGPTPKRDGGSSLQQPARVRNTVSDIGELPPVIRRRSSLLRELIEEDYAVHSNLPSIMDIPQVNEESGAAPARGVGRAMSRRLSALGQSLICDEESKNAKMADVQKAPSLFESMSAIAMAQ